MICHTQQFREGQARWHRILCSIVCNLQDVKKTPAGASRIVLSEGVQQSGVATLSVHVHAPMREYHVINTAVGHGNGSSITSSRNVSWCSGPPLLQLEPQLCACSPLAPNAVKEKTC